MSSHPGRSLAKVAIAMGDPAGIGPEIALKAALDSRVRLQCLPVLVGDERVARRHAEQCGLAVTFDSTACGSSDQSEPGVIRLLHADLLGAETLEMGVVKAQYGRAALDAARLAIDAALRGGVDAVVACPQNETAIKAAGIEFDGYPTFVARCTSTPPEDAFLMICFDDKRIVHTTLHVSVRRALTLITPARVDKCIRTAIATLQRQGIAQPKIGVSGLNPHAGEGGLFGDEDLVILIPCIERLQAEGLQVHGPIGADVLFQQDAYDAYVVMLHDQGHIAAKLLAPRRSAGMTIGTPITFSSVAHGTAMDIAGQNLARPDAVIEAIGRVVRASAPERAR